MCTTDKPTTDRISTYEVITIRQFVQNLEASQRMKRHLTSNIIESINSSDSDGESDITSLTDNSSAVGDLDFSETVSESGDEMSDWNVSTESSPVSSDVNEIIHDSSDSVVIITDVDATPEPDSTMQVHEEDDPGVLDIPTSPKLVDTSETPAPENYDTIHIAEASPESETLVSSVLEEKRIAKSNPESESPMSSESEERGIADSPESPASEERDRINMPGPPEPTGFTDISSSSPVNSHEEQSSYNLSNASAESSESTVVVVEDTLAVPNVSATMEIDPPDTHENPAENAIIPDASEILVNVETAPSGSAEGTQPFVRAGEAVCPPADDSDDGEPVRIFVPEEWEGEMSERAMKKKLREIINRHYKVGGTFVTMGDIRAKLIFCPHGNIYFRPMGSFKHPQQLSANIKIYPEL